MSRDSRLKWSVIVGMIALDVLLLRVLGLGFDLPSLTWPVGFVVLLTLVGLHYHRRTEPNFVVCINALLCLVLFSSSYTVLMYCVATFGRPLIDDPLAQLDALMGFHLPDIVAWTADHATIDRLLGMSYDTLLPQTALITALGLVGDRRPVEVFLQRFMLSALITLAVFCVYPAAGPFEAFGYARDDAQDRYMAQFEALRAGQMSTISLDSTEGLITLPSFHATWAILLALACRHHRLLFAFSALLNGLVVISTVTTGWHYVIDVIAGIVVAALAVVVCLVAGNWLYPEEASADQSLSSAA